MLGARVDGTDAHLVAESIAATAENVPYYIQHLVAASARTGGPVSPGDIPALLRAAVTDPHDPWGSAPLPRPLAQLLRRRRRGHRQPAGHLRPRDGTTRCRHRGTPPAFRGVHHRRSIARRVTSLRSSRDKVSRERDLLERPERPERDLGMSLSTANEPTTA